MAIGIQTAHANNVVVDMSQVQDYNQFQMGLQQCEGLAVQNQPDAPQREGVAGTAVRGAAAGAVTSAGLPSPQAWGGTSTPPAYESIFLRSNLTISGGKSGHRLIQIVFGVTRGNLHADACLALGHNRIEKPDGIDT